MIVCRIILLNWKSKRLNKDQEALQLNSTPTGDCIFFYFIIIIIIFIKQALFRIYIYNVQVYPHHNTICIVAAHSILTLGKASWLSSSCRFLMILRTRVLQANGSHRIMDRSLEYTQINSPTATEMSCSVQALKPFSHLTRGLALVLSSLHPGNLAALWLACRPQTSHECRRPNTMWTVAEARHKHASEKHMKQSVWSDHSTLLLPTLWQGSTEQISLMSKSCSDISSSALSVQ